MKNLFHLYLTTWWMPAVTSFGFFLMAMIAGVISNYTLTHDSNSLILALSFIIALFFAIGWPVSVLAILILGTYQINWGNDALGICNTWLGFATIVIFTLFLFLGLAIT